VVDSVCLNLYRRNDQLPVFVEVKFMPDAV
jgi:hypothetical protein